MRKMILFAICSVMAAWTYAQEITNVTAWEVLASDDFEKTPWVNFDQPSAEIQLNNALGGAQSYNWSDAWGGACIHDGKSAVSGEKCVQLHWGGNLSLQGFEINPAKIYRLEVAVHPNGSIDGGNWNDWGAVHLFVFDNSNIWQEQGIRIRVTNSNTAGNNPFRLMFDTWEGEDGTYRNGTVFDFSGEASNYTLNDAKDAAATHFWVPLKMIFTGEGSAENPFIIDFYLNEQFVGTQHFNNITWKGDSMIGLQKTGNDVDNARFDNFKLSVATGGTGIASVSAENKLVVSQSGKGQLTITYPAKNATYKMYNIAGVTVAQGALKDQATTVSTASIPAGIYILQATDKTTGASQTIRTIIK